MLLPATLDLMSSLTLFTAMMYVSGSIVQIFKGISFSYAALLSLVLLPGRRLFPFHKVSLLTAVVGIGLVTSSSFARDNSGPAGSGEGEESAAESEEGTGNISVGLLFAFLSSVATASRSVLCEKLMSETGVDSPTIVGYLGALSISASTVLLLGFWGAPGEDHGGVYENLEHTVWLLGHNRLLLTLVGISVTLGEATNEFSKVEATRIFSSVTALLIRN
eukprot:1798071-Rhodomonas_salina.1